MVVGEQYGGRTTDHLRCPAGLPALRVCGGANGVVAFEHLYRGSQRGREARGLESRAGWLHVGLGQRVGRGLRESGGEFTQPNTLSFDRPHR